MSSPQQLQAVTADKEYGAVLTTATNRKSLWMLLLAWIASMVGGITLIVIVSQVLMQGSTITPILWIFLGLLALLAFPALGYMLYYYFWNPRVTITLYEAGLRYPQRGTVRALKWSDIQRATYVRALTRSYDEQKGYGQYTEYTFHLFPKTGRSLTLSFYDQGAPKGREIGAQVLDKLRVADAYLIQKEV